LLSCSFVLFLSTVSPQDSSIESYLFGCDARHLVSTHGCWPCTFFACFISARRAPFLCARNQPDKMRVHAVLALHFSIVVFFFFPCVLLKAPQRNRAKAPQPSPERAPTKSRKGPNQVPKGPPTVRKHPRFRLESSEAMPNLASVLLVFLNSQCRASFCPLPLQHAMPFWCQQNESTHHFLKSLTFRRPTLLFRCFEQEERD
jgi:hypothetical protein